ncbi:MAG: asparagine synthase (glutamine-hydrolyzing) [Methylobacter sp.]|nr:asparagine synthase (glutamine-hydrolyzing) [Methylobacter sp.]
MCGICGFTGTPDRVVLEQMTDAIVHRGPDDAGHWDAPKISLGMRRLEIVDLETGQQPVFNEDGSICVVFNGEIYNHHELRAELETAGHKFRSHHSDTEVLVHLYEQYGDDFLNRLNGMFAIALWDSRRQRLLLARDRAGIKPLYIGQFHGRLLFASEIKSLLAHPIVERKPNYQALYHYFSFKNIPAPWSAFDGIEQLRPGERAIYEEGELKREQWWTLRYAEDNTIDEQSAAARIRELLEDSVRLRMGADVPFGAYLSGGVDSSSVVALMSRIGGHRVQTFSLVYADDFQHKAADQVFARQVARQYDTDHHEYELTHHDVADSFDAVLSAFDEPFSGVTSTYFVTRLIAKHVKVALSGDGADELFGSYLPHRLAQPLHHFPRLKDRLSGLPEHEQALLQPYLNQPEYLNAMLGQGGDEAGRRMSLYLWNDAGKRALFSEKMLALCPNESTEQLIRTVYDASGTADPLNRALNCDFLTLLPDQVLAFVDRLSMAHSVEVRPPFLDYRLMEFAATLPGSMKIKNGRSKHILKEAVRGLIPDEVIDRPKEGFVLPIDNWLLNEMRPLAEELLASDRLALHGLFQGSAVEKIMTEHYSRSVNHGPRIWNLMMFQRWWETYFE